MKIDEPEKYIWEMPLSRLCQITALRIVKHNKNIRVANRGFRNMIEVTSAHLSDADAAADASEGRDLCDRMEARVLKVKQDT